MSVASDLYLHYRQQLKEGVTKAEADHIIASACSDCTKGYISDIEYGKIYFAAVAIINEHCEATRKHRMQQLEV